MTTATVSHIAVVLHIQDDPKLLRDVQFWTEACRIQMMRHVAPAWRDFAAPPGVFFYGTAVGIPSDLAAVVGIVRDARDPDAAGYHSALGKQVLGVVDMSRSDSPSRTLSHEICEIFGNAYLTGWVQGPRGRKYARELCDPVQRISYDIDVDLLGEKRTVEVADFVLPSYFAEKGALPVDHCACVMAPFDPASGGYQIATDGDAVIYLPARGEGLTRAALTRPLSRTEQISRGLVIPPPASHRGDPP